MMQNLTILLIDDEEADFLLVRKLLSRIERVSYEMEWVATYDQVFAILKEKSFDVCILDYRLGEMDGLDLMQEILHLGITTPIIILTGYRDSWVEEHSLEDGASDFLPKQELTPSILDRTIRHCIKRKEIEAKLKLSEERYRELAEYSNAALHNIGNIMNSAHVANEKIGETLEKSNLSLLEKIGALIGEKGSTPGFFTETKQGKLILENLDHLIEALASERDANRTDVERIRKKLALMKDAIGQQQKFAKRCLGREDLDLNKVVEDALEIKSGLLGKRKIQVKTNLHSKLPIKGSRVKLTHVLINLIKNAVEAMGDCDEEEARLVISSEMDDMGGVILSIRDRGAGISPKNLKSLFTHGFTTKQDGHGFGLHYCARAMKEMGGDIKASSDGSGKGATFSLVFP